MKNFTCTNCNRALPTADAICTYCEEEFSLFPITGRYSCPNCTKRFEKPTEAYFPAHAKWYQPRTLYPQCPHCLVFLRDKKVPTSSWIYPVAVAALWLFANIYRQSLGIVLAGAFILLTVHLVRIHNAESSVRVEEERYAEK
jgi:hypothetical protein